MRTESPPRGPIRRVAPQACGPLPPVTARETSPALSECRISTTASPTTCSPSTWCGRMVTGFLVMFMQAGFAMVETGMCRAKNAAHTIAMNFMIYPLGCLGFWVYGFAFGWGNWFNGPVPPGWYSSLGPGTSVLEPGHRDCREIRGPRHQRILPGLVGGRHGGSRAVLLHDGVHGHHGHHPHRRDGGTLGVEELRASTACGSRFRIASTRTGSGEAAGSLRAASTGTSATAPSTSPGQASCTAWEVSLPSRARSS